MPTSKLATILALIWLASLSVQLRGDDMQHRFVQAQYNFDLTSAQQLVPEFEQAAVADGSEAAWLDYAVAALLVVELQRGDYEHEPLDRQQRRKLGRDIDKTAKAALAALKPLPDSSERYRLEADLLGSMIRSKFKGMKYQARLEEASARALSLDDSNVDAWVTNARRPLFASAQYGGDLTLALKYLNRALEINPEHVQALLLRGVAHSKLGETELADADWEHAAKLNPNTIGARQRLLEVEMPFEDQPPQ